MKLKLKVIIALVAQLVVHLTFVLEDLGSNSAQGKIFFFLVSFTFLKKLESLDCFLKHLKQRDNLGCLTKAKFVYISVHH